MTLIILGEHDQIADWLEELVETQERKRRA